MRKLILKMSVTVDGFVAGPNGEVDWLLKTMTPAGSSWVEKTLSQAGVHIMGSRTFRDMAAYWPTSSHPLAAPMNEIPKMVFSKTGRLDLSQLKSTQALKDAKRMDSEKKVEKITASESASTWTNASVASDLVSEIKKLKQQEGKYILAHGGASFAQSLVKHDLIDEYRLVIHPVILGKGLPLFNLANPLYLTRESSTALEGGSVANIYTRN